MKLVSVAMTTYNGLPHIKKQLASILRQLPETGEIICGDDGSIDGTVEYLESIRDPRFRLIKNKDNLGVVGNFENVIALCSGQYILLADQDDLWFPNKVERMVAELSKGYTLVVHDAIVTDAGLSPRENSYFVTLKPSCSLWRNLVSNTLVGAMMGFSQELRGLALPFPSGIGMHDIWIGLVSLSLGRTSLLPELLMYYRRHDATYSSTLSISHREIGVRLKERFLTGRALFRRTTRCKRTN